jgi:RNA polymerase sigma-70 factor (ECF subfamily)
MNAGDGDTVLGGARRDFPSTCWSRLIATPQDTEERAKAWEGLIQQYWKPVFAYIRSSRGAPVEDAKDLTQDFFLWMMETDFPSRADPARGRFRGLLKTSLKHYLARVDERRRTLKRGGDRRFVSLNAEEVPIPDRSDPESILDEVWKNGLIVRSIELLEATLIREGRDDTFRVFRDYHLAGSAAPDYREVGARYGLGPQDVDNALRYAKKRLRGIMADLVAETVSDETELKEEWESLFGKGGP